jgi:hypothetical protein
MTRQKNNLSVTGPEMSVHLFHSLRMLLTTSSSSSFAIALY